MSHPITYYAIVGQGATVERPLGLLRRLRHDVGWEDEALQRNMSWAFTPLVVEYEHDSFGHELVEVTHAQADKIIQYFRDKRAAEDQGS